MRHGGDIYIYIFFPVWCAAAMVVTVLTAKGGRQKRKGSGEGSCVGVFCVYGSFGGFRYGWPIFGGGGKAVMGTVAIGLVVAKAKAEVEVRWVCVLGWCCFLDMTVVLLWFKDGERRWQQTVVTVAGTVAGVGQK
ncbi:Uncharacterized protein M6B38_226330 [Iris pallida]|uniref:Transmembrane protein n=1 Tax=Iris pallida TaxID=29817 RepID=A0AAX6DU32_IRIPA|nr:Uncharacterized protein M6B38_226330 [Iris pallida]